ncbi:glycoside hydrolase family protein [Rickettsia sp. 2024-CO-Wats]|uniref:glycoside hydrolase family protein n=1 Tax=unclassified Rickettsia TaxID=114295 RepID=UPI00370DDEC9
MPLTENQQAALISFIFNCGAGAFQASTLRQKLNRGEYANAANNELLRWMRAKGGLSLQGLKHRQYYRL